MVRGKQFNIASSFFFSKSCLLTECHNYKFHRSRVNPTQCFWLSSEYFQDAVEFLAMNVSSTSTLHSSILQAYYASEADIPNSEYSAGISNK